MAGDLSTFLMFESDAEAAMTLFVSLIPNSRIDSIERWSGAFTD